nr:DNA polymerase III subunit gamma/tau [Malacoplasma sp.]
VAYYRKYRPNSFERIQGQDFIVKTLKNAVSQNKISHAYIFSGPRGIGKTSIAKIFSKAINCLDSKNGDCCNKCKNCELINTNKTLDIIELDAASNNGVNEIRTIIDSSDYKPLDLKSKVYIIDEVHMLTNAAWNALLKTLEEPPKHLVFIFATTESFKIPPTIISRCQRYNLSRLSYLDIKKELKEIIKKEDIKIDEKALDKIISISDGSARDALTILDQLDSYTNSDIKEDDVKEIFGLVSIEDKLDLIAALVSSDYEKVVSKIDEYDRKGIDFYRLALEISEILFEKLVYERTKKINLLNNLPTVNVNFISIQPKFLIFLIEIWQKSINILKYSTSSRFNFESTCLSCFKIFEFDNFATKILDKPLEKENIIKDIKINKDIPKNENLQDLKMNYVDKETVLKNVKIKNPILNHSKDETATNQEEKKNGLVHVPNEEIKNENKKQISENNKKNISKNDNQSIVDAIISKSFETKSLKLSEIKNRFLKNSDEFNINQDLESVYESKKESIKVKTNKVKNNNFDEDSLFTVSTNAVNDEPYTKIIAKDISNDKDIVSTNPVKKSEVVNKKTITKEEKVNDSHSNLKDLENIFFQIAFNNNSKEKEKVVNIFNELKHNIPLSPEEGLLTDAEKILLVSNNGIVVIFEDEVDARNINAANDESKFVTYIKNKFGKVFYVLGLSIDEAKRISSIYKEYYKQNKKFDDVNVDELSKMVKIKTTAKDIAERLVSDLIVDEEDEEN